MGGIYQTAEEIDMSYETLKHHLIDVIKEEQIKLGYRKEVIRLYYPKESLEHLLGLGILEYTDFKKELLTFAAFVEPELGKLGFSRKENRFCIVIPEEGVEYVHEQISDRVFLEEFIQTIGRHGCTLEEIHQVFLKHSSRVQLEKMDHDEFHYLLYFQDGDPDDYRYCIRFEEEHAIYHRFTPTDYGAFDF